MGYVLDMLKNVNFYLKDLKKIKIKNKTDHVSYFISFACKVQFQ